MEIHTPKITPGVSEGGADVFKLDYFGRERFSVWFSLSARLESWFV